MEEIEANELNDLTDEARKRHSRKKENMLYGNAWSHKNDVHLATIRMIKFRLGIGRKERLEPDVRGC